MPHFKLRLGGNTMVLPIGTHELGRSSDCWLTLHDELSSRVHARLHVDESGCEIEDLGSRNGTFVNGEQLKGRKRLADGDRIRIGRELMTILESETVDIGEASARLRQTLAPGEQSGLPELMGQLIEKSLKVGKTRDAERYAAALHTQLAAARKLAVDHPAVRTGVTCLLQVAEHTKNGIWVDKLFHLYAEQSWVLDPKLLDQIRSALDRIARIPGNGLQTYEARLREMAREGVSLPGGLLAGIGELVDAYGGR